MLMKKIAAFIVVAGLLVGGTALAGEAVVGKFSGMDTIEWVYPTNEGYVFVLANTTFAEANPHCDYGKRFKVLVGDNNYNAKVSTILAAFMSGKKIQVYRDVAHPQGTCEAHVRRFRVQR